MIQTGVLARAVLFFDARSTTGGFTGGTSEVYASLEVGPTVGSARAWVEFAAASLRTGVELRDADLRRSLESSKYPIVRFELERVEAATEAQLLVQPFSGRAIGRFTVHGVTRQLRVPIDLAPRGDSLRVASEFQLDLRDFKVGGLTKLFGLLRMEPVVAVRAELLFLLTGDAADLHRPVVAQPGLAVVPGGVGAPEEAVLLDGEVPEADEHRAVPLDQHAVVAGAPHQPGLP